VTTLSGKQIRHLRSLGHHLDPVVQLGKLGLTDEVTAAIDEALTRHELIKVRVGTECPTPREELAESLPVALSATLAQTLGRTLLLYRRHPKKPVIDLSEKKLAAKAKPKPRPTPRTTG
jgi:RNA-binding protein